MLGAEDPVNETVLILKELTLLGRNTATKPVIMRKLFLTWKDSMEAHSRMKPGVEGQKRSPGKSESKTQN